MASVNKVGQSPVQAQQQPGFVARCAGRCGLSQKSSIAPATQAVVVKNSGLSACVSNVFAAIRKCLSCIPVVGRLFVAKPAPVVAAPVAPKSSFSATVTNAALGALAKSKEFVVGHKGLTAAVVASGAAVVFRSELMNAGENVWSFANGYFKETVKGG